MKVNDNLQKIRRNIYWSLSQDGLWDIFLGLFLLNWGPALDTSLNWFTLPSFVPTFLGVYIIVLILKRRITYPRIGYVKFVEDDKRSKLGIIFGVTLFFNILFYLLATGRVWDIQPDVLVLLFGILTALVVCLIAYWWKIARMYAFAGLVLVVFIIHQVLQTPVIYSFIVPGAFIFIYGLVLLIRFIGKYPRQDEEAQIGNR